jgi:hypothetical protein
MVSLPTLLYDLLHYMICFFITFFWQLYLKNCSLFAEFREGW